MARNKERRGSVVDFVLVLLLVALASGAVLRFLDRQTDATDSVNTEARVLLAVEAIPTQTADCLTVGDVVYNADGTSFGTLSAIEVTPARVILEKDGAFFEGRAPDGSVDLRLAVLVPGAYSASLFLRNGRHPLPIGMSLTLYTDRVALHVTVVGTVAHGDDE